MIVPNFSLSQTPTHLTISISLPYIRVSAAETLVDGAAFHFSCAPYLLKLTFPGPLVDDEENPAHATYDPNDDRGTLTVTLLKREPGDFEDLDLTTRLLQPRREAPTRAAAGPPLIEVVGEAAAPGAAPDPPPVDRLVYDESLPDESLPAASSPFLLSPSSRSCPPPAPSISVSASLAPRYGFNRSHHSAFSSLRAELREMCECASLDSLRPAEARALRLEAEREKYDEGRYCGDFFANDPRFAALGEGRDPLYEAALLSPPAACVPPPAPAGDVSEQLASLSVSAPPPAPAFTPAEAALLSSLPNLEHLLPSPPPRHLLLGLLDVLFAYCYDQRLTSSEGSVESPWTISILAPSLSWLEVYDAPSDSPASVLLGCVRRSLVYPYLRLLSFAAAVVVPDVLRLLSLGRRGALRAFLGVRAALDGSETHYLLNRFVVDDYCVFLQEVGEDAFGAFAGEVEREWGRFVEGGLGRVRGMLDLDLEEAEALVLADLEEEQ
ncbi:hypothetical protein TeGR_g8809 [Tetraparma gracilis]|uniref:CS domain-containing protein n=1 Tax=Tetraparma gracilis TaxID=2962635 RepID=A0ABQ6MLF8_9STRA|nr:hypothetical protein TeGR_g8809 [Tetraparma gracilis]